jgi:lambda family phage tail tape measure protein
MGDVFDAGNVIPFAGGGIVDRPTFFPMAKGTGLMGEAGPEAIIPLARKSDGSLGIKGGGQVINLGGITIVGTNKSPEQLAREIVKPLKEELRRLQATGG